MTCYLIKRNSSLLKEVAGLLMKYLRQRSPSSLTRLLFNRHWECQVYDRMSSCSSREEEGNLTHVRQRKCFAGGNKCCKEGEKLNHQRQNNRLTEKTCKTTTDTNCSERKIRITICKFLSCSLPEVDEPKSGFHSSHLHRQSLTGDSQHPQIRH